MADEPARPHPHFYLPGTGKAVGYTAHAGGGGGSAAPERDRAAHAQQLTQALTQVVAAGETLLANRDPQIAAGTPGFYVEFILPADQAGMVDKLERKGKFPIELVSVQPSDEHHVAATVFVPESQRGYYLGKVQAYEAEDNVKEKTLEDGSVVETRKPKNERLVASIETARLAVARSFYTDAADLFPAPAVQTWWEVWLRKGTRVHFEGAAQTLGLAVRENSLEFAEREVVVVHATAEDLGRIIANTDTVAELRMARDTPGFFMGLDGAEQRLWADDLLDRLDPCDAEAPAVCLLDSGTTIAHKLIGPLLDAADQQAYDAAWSVEDTLGATASLAMTGNGAAVTARQGQIEPSLFGPPVLITGHPAAILRAPDPSRGAVLRDQLASALVMARRYG